MTSICAGGISKEPQDLSQIGENFLAVDRKGTLISFNLYLVSPRKAFMFIIWQSGQDLARADAGYHRCGHCGAECSSTMIVRYSYTNFYFVLGVVTGYEYFLACDDCDACLQLPKHEAKAITPHVPIPFMRRFGCLSVVGILLSIWLIATLVSMIKS